MKINRAFLIVLDSLGAGEAPDAAEFGDAGANTIRSASGSKYFHAPNMLNLGYGNIAGLDFLGKVDCPTAAHGRLRECSRGKDTTIGHWEIAGVVSESPMPTYPQGFPDEIISEFERQTGRGVLCNRPASGTRVILEYGEEHINSGKLIVYTSSDSVFQIAAHEDVVPVETLYEYCRIARRILVGKHAVGRVIARPFAGTFPGFYRTPKRHDFSLEPPKKTLLDAVSGAGLDVISVGKISDIFAGRGVTESHYTTGNTDGMRVTLELTQKNFHGLCFTNLVDFDALYGHRRDVDGYAKAIAEFDGWLPGFVSSLGEGDIFMITADHGCDPAYPIGTDHTREYVPLLVGGKGVRPSDLGTRDCFADIAATLAELLGVDLETVGRSFADLII